MDDSDLIITIIEELEPPHVRAMALIEGVGKPFNPGNHGGWRVGCATIFRNWDGLRTRSKPRSHGMD